MELSVESTGQAFGVFVRGVDLRSSLAPSVIEELHELWSRHHVLVFPEQPMDDDDLERLSLAIGPFGVDPFIAPIPGRQHVAAIQRDADETTPIFAENWHSDWSFQAVPPAGTLLMSVETPPYGGDTLFASQHLAFAALSPERQEYLSSLTAIHSARGGYAPDGFYSQAPKDEQWAMDFRPSAEAYATQHHPLVITHPVNQQPAIFGCYGYIVGLVGVDDEQARQTLTELIRHQGSEQFLYRHRWQPDMVVLWDNRSVLHRATGGYDGYRRVLHRTTVAPRDGQAPLAHRR